MISGRIVVHNEPQRYRTKHTGWTRFSGLGELDDDQGYLWMDNMRKPTFTPKLSQDLLENILAVGNMEGFIVGAKVRRASDNPGIGTIVQVFDKLETAMDTDCTELCPYRVTWDAHPVFQGGTFNYGLDEIKIYIPPVVPLLEYNKDETLPHISVSC